MASDGADSKGGRKLLLPARGPHGEWIGNSTLFPAFCDGPPGRKAVLSQTRTNLTVLLDPGMEDLPGFFKDHEVHLVASLPCYTKKNVSA